MSGSVRPSVGSSVDWQFAGTVGARLARSGPPATEYTRRQASLSPAAQAFIDLLHKYHRPREREAAQLKQGLPKGAGKDGA